MKKIIILILIVFGIVAYTPIIPMIYVFCTKDLHAKISGSLIYGFKITNLRYKTITANNIKIKYNLDSNIQTLTIGKIKLSNLNINLKNIKLLQINGTVLKTGKLTAIYELTTRKLTWNINDLHLKQTIDLSGHVYFDNNIYGNIKVKDNAGNNASLKVTAAGIAKLAIYMPNNIWLPKQFGKTTGNITFDTKSFTAAQGEIHSKFNKQDIEITANNQLIKALIDHNWQVKIKLELQEHIANLTSLITNFIDRFKPLYRPRARTPENFSKITITSNIPQAFLPKNILSKYMPINATIKFTPNKPNQTLAQVNIRDITTNFGKQSLHVKQLTINSAPNKSNLLIKGTIDNQPINIDVKQTNHLEANITAGQIPIIVNDSVKLILSPNIKLIRFGDINLVNGHADIFGGTIGYNKYNIIKLPKNLEIIGTKPEISMLSRLSQNTYGSINLITVKPIKLAGIAGLKGDLSGELLLNLDDNKPKFNGNVKLINAIYQKNKHILVNYAHASYENTEIDNPFVDIKLTRTISKPSFDLNTLADKKDTVGVNILGTAEQPDIRTFSNNANLNKMQIISALETGSVNGISPAQGIFSAFSILGEKTSTSPLESIEKALNLDELYFLNESNDPNDNLINPNLSEASIVFSKTLFDKVKASFITGLHNKDYLVTIGYPVSSKLNATIYSSRINNPHFSRSLDNYGINLLWHLNN